MKALFAGGGRVLSKEE